MTSKPRKEAAARERHIRGVVDWFRSTSFEQLIKHILDHLKNIAFGAFFVGSSALLEGNESYPEASTFLYAIGIIILVLNGLAFFLWINRLVPETFLAAVFGSPNRGRDNQIILLVTIGVLYMAAIAAVVRYLSALKAL